MDGITGLVAVIMIFGMPTAVLAMYTFYRVRKLRTDERMAAITRGASVPMMPDLSETARSRRSGILLVAGAVGYMRARCLGRGCFRRYSARPGPRLLSRLGVDSPRCPGVIVKTLGWLQGNDRKLLGSGGFIPRSETCTAPLSAAPHSACPAGRVGNRQIRCCS
jgi:hypothetical protein